MVLSFALYVSLVAFGNLTDYNSNFFLVSHVLAMDTTFPDNRLMWRAIESPVLQHIAYGLIIGTEIVIALLCWIGGLRMLKTAGNAATFNHSKKMAILGLTLGFLLWFTGFMTIGGEWFLMWQSDIANAQQAAFRLVVIIAIILTYLVRSDEEGQV